MDMCHGKMPQSKIKLRRQTPEHIYRIEILLMSVVEEYRNLWRSSETAPELFSYLARIGSCTSADILMILRIDQQYRWRTGSPLHVEDYLEKLPALPIGIDWRRELLKGELLAQNAIPQTPDRDEYSSHYPDPGSTLYPAEGDAKVADVDSTEIDKLCDSFEAVWQTQIEQPQLEDFVTLVQESSREAAFHELLQQEIWWRRKRGEKPVTEDYLGRFPRFETVIVSLLSVPETNEPRTQKAVPSGTGSGIPGYKDLKPIGSGAMGIVYKARQLGTNRKVAIKLIRPEFEFDEKARQLFIREASITSRLHHPRIVRCLAFGFSGPRPYLVMEYIKSRDLENLVWKHDQKRRVRLSVKIVLQILEALMAAHRAGIVHRDIKPANIMALRQENTLKLKVSDFGLAKLFETAGHSGITATGELCGTLAYMSPEQLLDSRSAGPECDVYASAVCLFRLLTAEYPYPEYSLSDSFRYRLTEDARKVREFNPHVPEPLANIINEALNRDFELRLRSAEELYRKLKAWIF
jgi:tRNA A-37 threonylcarbamoyl transferase component Bud32